MNNSKMLLSILCLYGEGHTRECIESVINKPNIDLLLIDNGAEESVKNLLNTYEQNNPTVKVLHNPVNIFVNPGLNQCMQYFLEHPEYEYLIMINSDLILYPNWDEVVRKRLAIDSNEICMPTIVPDKMFTGMQPNSDVVEGTVITGGVNGVFMIVNQVQANIVCPIPESLLIWFGDNWILELMRGFGFKTIMSNNFLGYHAHSQNVSKVEGISAMIEADKVAWNDIVAPQMLKLIEEYNSNSI